MDGQFFYASAASGSVLTPAGWTRVLLPDPAAAAVLTLQANQELSGIQTLSLFSESNVYVSLRSRTLTAKPQCELHTAGRSSSL